MEYATSSFGEFQELKGRIENYLLNPAKSNTREERLKMNSRLCRGKTKGDVVVYMLL